LFLPNLFRLRRLMRGAIAVNAHYIGAQYLPLAFLRLLRASPPLIFSVHGSDVTDILASSKINRALCRWMLSQADLIVACSEALASRMAELKPKTKIVAIWNGVNRPPQMDYPRPHASRYVVCVASFWFNKGHDILLEAFESVLKSFPDMDLVLIGNNAPQREAVLEDIRRRGLETKIHVKVNLPHDDVWPWVQNAECLILPSRNEGLGICLLEAALVKTPVVATAVGGVPEIVVNRERGLLCGAEDPGALARAIIETLSRPEEAASRARRFYDFARGLTWDSAIRKYRVFAKLA
jgi:glycosyltransferase involved in cell wall biosynthesis